jgi:hypothetical protein
MLAGVASLSGALFLIPRLATISARSHLNNDADDRSMDNRYAEK